MTEAHRLRRRELVTGLGATGWDVASVGDQPRDFPLRGATGGAAMEG